MSEDIIAILCRAMGEADDGESFPEYPDIAEACLNAIANAGYVIVPLEPSAEMLASVDGEDSDKFVARGRAYSAWKAMIATHAKGEMR